MSFNSSADGERWFYRKHDNFPIAQAGNVGFVCADKSNSVWILASGHAFLRGIDFPWSQIKLADHLICVQIDERHRIILMVGDKQLLAIETNSQAGNHRTHRRDFCFRAISDSKPGFMAQRYWFPGFSPVISLLPKNMNVVILSAAGKE